MKHPNQATLALQAGGDLGFWSRWRLSRHLAGCEECREEVAAYESMREILPELAEIPDVPWNRLAADMKANIRLGLAAGECVRAEEAPLRESRLFTGARAAVALASVLLLLATGLVLEHPAPRPADEGMVVQTIAGGIQVRRGGQAMRLMNAGARKATYSPNAQGGMSSLYFNDDTGQVTINRVEYAE
jgi:hypothetical protein